MIIQIFDTFYVIMLEIGRALTERGARLRVPFDLRISFLPSVLPTRVFNRIAIIMCCTT